MNTELIQKLTLIQATAEARLTLLRSEHATGPILDDLERIAKDVADAIALATQ